MKTNLSKWATFSLVWKGQDSHSYFHFLAISWSIRNYRDTHALIKYCFFAQIEVPTVSRQHMGDLHVENEKRDFKLLSLVQDSHSYFHFLAISWSIRNYRDTHALIKYCFFAQIEVPTVSRQHMGDLHVENEKRDFKLLSLVQ